MIRKALSCKGVRTQIVVVAAALASGRSLLNLKSGLRAHRFDFALYSGRRRNCDGTWQAVVSAVPAYLTHSFIIMALSVRDEEQLSICCFIYGTISCDTLLVY